MIAAPSGQPLPFKAVLLVTKAILPPLTAKFAVPEASGAGRFEPTAPPDPSANKKYFPGGSKQGLAGQSAATFQVLPVAEACWTDQPAKSTVVVPRLKISMKSFLNTAPEFPPPP